MRFLMSVTSMLSVSESYTHVGALTFDTRARMEFDFSAVQDTDAVNDRFARMVWHQGYTYTDEGIALGTERLFSFAHGMRFDAAKVGGLSYCCTSILFRYAWPNRKHFFRVR